MLFPLFLCQIWHCQNHLLVIPFEKIQPHTIYFHKKSIFEKGFLMEFLFEIKLNLCIVSAHGENIFVKI